MKKNRYEECLDKIYKLGRFGIKLELDTILNILRLLNNPHKNYKTVHIAGTNGKGSTATYIASMLQNAGFKTGIYTSPHLIRFNERICVNGQEILDEDVVNAYEAVHAVDIGKRKATFFEIATAMSFYHFAKQNVDWAVMETGMGGRCDATNIIRPEVSVITNLSIEHTDYLGNTIKALAREKGGIIKPNVPLVTGVSQPSALKVIQKITKEKKADLFLFKNDFSIRKNPGKESYSYKGIKTRVNNLAIPLPGDHQKENASLAIAACELIFKKRGETLSSDMIKQGLGSAKWPGRLENVMEKPLVIIDGAHNKKAAQVLGKHLKKTLNGKTLTLVIGILDDKPYEEMLKSLIPCADNIIITKAKIERSLEPSVLKKSVEKMGKKKVHIIEDVKEAVDHALSCTPENGAICIAGSLYVAGEAKEKFDNDIQIN
ncbi:MAG: bifunctional folylpolyglutamate synthase/dihydrofolate synthase [Desulfobacteraceae bacterium]|nr:bifunctional folylpolyglutamate synthase/dihydrofolate synthase [Desulfobacteraceae bacterium]